MSSDVLGSLTRWFTSPGSVRRVVFCRQVAFKLSWKQLHVKPHFVAN